MVFSVYSIGAFAELGGVSIRMLRHYDGIGLLTQAFPGSTSWNCRPLPSRRWCDAVRCSPWTKPIR